MNEEIKEWQTQSVKHKVAYLLMMDGVSFQLRGGYRHRVLRPRFLCGEYDLQTCELLWVQCKTDY